MRKAVPGFDLNVFAERLRTARETCRLTQEAVGKAVGVHRITVTKWEAAKTTPTGVTLLALASLLRVDKPWLIGQDRQQDEPDPWLRIPHYAGTSAVKGKFDEADRADEFLQIKKNWLRITTPHPGDVVAVDIVDDSMSPTLNPGDVAMVDTAHKKPAGLVMINFFGSVAVRRLAMDLAGKQLMVATDNPARPDVSICVEKEEAIPSVLGRIVSVWRKL